MATLHMPHPPERLSALAAFIIQAFWVVAGGIVLVYAFFVLLGAIDPGDVAVLSFVVLALVAVAGARAWAVSHRERQERDPRLIKARERRGF
jgi:hypothetical protein